MRIREAQQKDAAAIARVRVDSWRSTYRGILPDQTLDELSYEENTRNWQHILAPTTRHNYAYVAEDEDGNVVGFALGGPERTNNPNYTGEVYAIYLLEDYQGQGLGRKLTQAVARRLAQEGMHSLLIWVLSENAARAFYAALGGQAMYEKEITFGDASFKEIAYVWPDIRPLIDEKEEL